LRKQGILLFSDQRCPEPSIIVPRVKFLPRTPILHIRYRVSKVAVSLRAKFRIMVAVAAVGLLALAGFWIKNQHSNLLSERQQKTRNLVEIPVSLIAQQYQLETEGKISRAKAQQNALASIRAMRYDGENYFWINDEHPTMVMHPMKPELDGKDLTDLKDPDGKAIFVEFVNAARDPEGGFVYYLWPKPGESKPVAKLSFVKRFAPWGWVIGTGIYIDDVDAAWQRSALTAGGLALACLVPLLVVALSTSRSIFHRLREMIERIRDIAEGEGDLTKRIEIAAEDEIGELAQWFNTFVDKLHDILCQVASNTKSLAAAGKEIAASSREHGRGAELQKDQTNQVATAMQEMVSTVQQVSENCNSASTASQKASQSARQGGKIVGETLSRMRAIAQAVGGTAKQIQELGKRSDQIGQIIGVIDDIADQTNLLALNAAIEAARAGEQGRGFAVVADEVRKLAERTSTATKEITDMIRNIQVETKNAVGAMLAGTKEVELGVESTTTAGSSLHEIIQTNEHVGDMIAHIATATTQQSATTEQINGSIEQIAKIAASSAIAMQQTNEALQDLSALASSLQTLVGQFRLRSNGDGKSLAHGRGSRVEDKIFENVDFARVKMTHRGWRVRLRRFLDGSEDIDPGKLGSHQDCELGKWIYADALPNYGQLQDVQSLEKKHKEMHALVKQVVELKRAGKTLEAETQFAGVTQAAEEVVGLLNQVETQVTHPAELARAASV
jgi:methyl-accepting chemotaxis protein